MQLLVVFVTNDIGGDGGGVVTSIANSSCAAGMAFSRGDDCGKDGEKGNCEDGNGVVVGGWVGGSDSMIYMAPWLIRKEVTFRTADLLALVFVNDGSLTNKCDRSPKTSINIITIKRSGGRVPAYALTDCSLGKCTDPDAITRV